MVRLAVLNPKVKFVLAVNDFIALESVRQDGDLGEVTTCLASLCGLFPQLSVKDFHAYKDDEFIFITLKQKSIKKECWVFSINQQLCEPPNRIRRLIKKLLGGKSLVILKVILPQTAFEIYKREVWIYDIQTI